MDLLRLIDANTYINMYTNIQQYKYIIHASRDRINVNSDYKKSKLRVFGYPI